MVYFEVSSEDWSMTSDVCFRNMWQFRNIKFTVIGDNRLIFNRIFFYRFAFFFLII